MGPRKQENEVAKSATDVMHDVIVAAVIDGIMALRAASGGLPNGMLRDLNAVHANTTFADLPKDVQTAIAASVRAAFTRLLKEGYSVSSATAPAPRTPQRDPTARPPHHRGKIPADRRRGPSEPSGPPRGKPPRGNRGGPRTPKK